METRFKFGDNWRHFSNVLNEERIQLAEQSLRAMLGVEALTSQHFIDVGSGSGLFSLAAMRLGAARVHSFDYDAESVACTQELKRCYFPAAAQWTIERGDVLDSSYLSRLGKWDVVYSWGVLHHTGRLWSALENIVALSAPGGLLFVSVYNDQGWLSDFWKGVKRFYNRGRLAQGLTLAWFVPGFCIGALVADLLHLRNPWQRYLTPGRGMSVFYDWFDWLGGYPFEVAQPGQVEAFLGQHGFDTVRVQTVGQRSGCNEFVFRNRKRVF